MFSIRIGELMNFTGPLPVQFFFQAEYLARCANSFGIGVGIAVAAGGTDGAGVGVGSGSGVSFVGEGSSSTLAITLVSGDGVSAVLPSPPQDAISKKMLRGKEPV